MTSIPPTRRRAVRGADTHNTSFEAPDPTAFAWHRHTCVTGDTAPLCANCERRLRRPGSRSTGLRIPCEGGAPTGIVPALDRAIDSGSLEITSHVEELSALDLFSNDDSNAMGAGSIGLDVEGRHGGDGKNVV